MGRRLTLVALFGSALLYGDGLITPVISVLSALEGLEVATKAAKPAKVAKAAKAAKVEEEAADEDGGDEEEDAKKTRVQLTSVLEISISHARCATHLKHNLGDAAIEAEIKQLRANLKAAKTAEDADQITALKAEISKLSMPLVRLSNETPIATAVIWDGAVKELLRHGMNLALAGERKIVEVAHLHEGSPAELACFPMYDRCPIWTEYDPAVEDGLKKARALENKAAKDAREAKKEGKAPEAHAEEEAEEEGEGEGQHTKTTFYTYVENALKAIKKEPEYSTMRVSNRVREYISELIAQGITRLSGLARILVQSVMSVRTMNAGHIKAVVHMLLVDAGRSAEDVEGLVGPVDEKLQRYRDHVKLEKEKKAELVDEPTKAARVLAKQVVELVNTKKRHDVAVSRAHEAAKLAKSLTLKTVELEAVIAAAPVIEAAA